MNRVIFYTYKISSKINLLQLASYFNFKKEAGWKEYLKLDNKEIEKIFKFSSDKTVYLYKFGCITFVNFNLDEIYYFFDYLRKIFITIDNKFISRYNESHIIKISEEGKVKLWHESEQEYIYNSYIVDIVAAVLAKSTELNMIEAELSKVLDEADIFITYLKQGKLRANSKKIISTMAKCIKFKYYNIESIKILDRPVQVSKTIESRNIFSIFSEYFELSDRYNIFSSRINVLDSITEEYFDFRNNQSERRLIMFEILLLCLFPLMHLIG